MFRYALNSLSTQSARSKEVTSTLVVISPGYVGLPLVARATNVGFQVVGLDSSDAVVDELNRGYSHIDDVHDSDVKEIVSRGFVATTSASRITTADVVVICVRTPLDGELGPNLKAVEDAARRIAQHLFILLASCLTCAAMSRGIFFRWVSALMDLRAPSAEILCMQIFYAPWQLIAETTQKSSCKSVLRAIEKCVGVDHEAK